MVDKALIRGRLNEFGQYITHRFRADDAGSVPMRRSGGNVQHIAGTSLHRVIGELVTDVSGQDEDRMTGLAPAGFGASDESGARS